MVIIENESHKCSGIRVGRIVTFPFSSDFAHDFITYVIVKSMLSASPA